MELIGANDSAYRVAAAAVVKVGQAHPETCDLDQHFGTVVDEILAVPGHLVVLPRVVRDSETDVMRARTGIRVPPAGLWIEVQLLTHLTPVAARLPGIHRAEIARPSRGKSGLGKAPITIEQQ